jgi:hypothetical protein
MGLTALIDKFVSIDGDHAIGMGPIIVIGVVIFGGFWGAIIGLIAACIITKNTKNDD